MSQVSDTRISLIHVCRKNELIIDWMHNGLKLLLVTNLYTLGLLPRNFHVGLVYWKCTKDVEVLDIFKGAREVIWG